MPVTVYERIASLVSYNPNGLVYHYTTMQNALEYILYTGTIRLSRLEKVNDPKESKPTYSFSLNNSTTNVELFEFYERFLTFPKIICLSIDNKCYFKNVDDMNRFPGKGFNHPRMWAQYGENHRGICFVFDVKRLYSELRITHRKRPIFRGRVNYSDKYIDCNINNESPYSVDLRALGEIGKDKLYIEHLTKFRNTYFFSKHKDWIDECEYRFVLLDDNSNDVFIDLRTSIVAVILGSEFPMCHKPTLVELCKELKIDAFKISWYQGIANNLNLVYEYEE